MNTIRVVAIPAGEAPVWVREAWIGIILPLAKIPEGTKLFAQGVLGGFPHSENEGGYVVETRVAITSLKSNGKMNPVQWWESNVDPNVLKYLQFGKRFCELL